ncbi:MAG: LacI family DNA-binding transcriptional regulator [Janthinobacterium lividum]
MTRSARMTDVAKLAGVSAMTVSRVLNNHRSVSDETRTKVNAAVKQLRYQPNELARSLREQRSRQIGVLLPYLFDPFFAICGHAISTVAKQHSYSIVLSTSNENPQSEFDEANRMLRRNVEGLIVIPAQVRDGKSLLLEQPFQQLPIVTLDRPVAGGQFTSVLVENERGAQMGTEHLLRLGQRRIAYIGLTNDLYTMRMRQGGYVAAMTNAGLKPEIALLSGVLDGALDSVRKLLAQRRPPTALFCANNLVTRHVLHSLQKLNLHPPDPIALVGFDDFDTADLIRPGITVIRQPIEQLAQHAAKVLFEQLEGKRRSSRKTANHITLPVELIVRGSCGARV